MELKEYLDSICKYCHVFATCGWRKRDKRSDCPEIDLAEATWEAAETRIPSYDTFGKLERLIRNFYDVNEQWIDSMYYEDKPTDEVDEEIQQMKYRYIVAHWND